MQPAKKPRLENANFRDLIKSRRRVAAIETAVIEALETRLLRTAFGYTGTVQTYTVPQTANYDLTVGGAAGGNATNQSDTTTYAGGSGRPARRQCNPGRRDCAGHRRRRRRYQFL